MYIVKENCIGFSFSEEQLTERVREASVFYLKMMPEPVEADPFAAHLLTTDDHPYILRTLAEGMNLLRAAVVKFAYGVESSEIFDNQPGYFGFALCGGNVQQEAMKNRLELFDSFCSEFLVNYAIEQWASLKGFGVVAQTVALKMAEITGRIRTNVALFSRPGCLKSYFTEEIAV